MALGFFGVGGDRAQGEGGDSVGDSGACADPGLYAGAAGGDSG